MLRIRSYKSKDITGFTRKRQGERVPNTRVFSVKTDIREEETEVLFSDKFWPWTHHVIHQDEPHEASVYWRHILNHPHNTSEYIHYSQAVREVFFPQLQNIQNIWSTNIDVPLTYTPALPYFFKCAHFPSHPSCKLCPHKLMTTVTLRALCDTDVFWQFIWKTYYYLFYSNQGVKYTLMIEKVFEIFWTRTQIQKAIMNTTIYQQTTSKGQTQEKNSEAKLHSAKKEKRKQTKKQPTKTNQTPPKLRICCWEGLLTI